MNQSSFITLPMLIPIKKRFSENPSLSIPKFRVYFEQALCITYSCREGAYLKLEVFLFLHFEPKPSILQTK